MIEHSPEPLDSQTVAKSDSRVRRTRGWWWRLAKWGAIVGGLLLVLLVAGGVLAYAKRTTILNAILDATAPYRISAGRMEFDADGNLEFFDVQLNDDRAAGEGAAGNPTGTVITIPHASGLIDLRDALGGKIVSVTIDKPVIRIPLKSVMHGEAPAGLEAIEEEVSKIAPEFVSPRFALDRLVVNDAEMRVGDAISGRFDYDADALALYADGSIETRRHKLSVRDVRFAGPDTVESGKVMGETEWASIPSAEVEFSIHRAGGLIQLHKLEIPTGKLKGDAAMLRWLVSAGFGPLFVPPDTEAVDGRAIDSNTGNVSPFSKLAIEQLVVGEFEFGMDGFHGLPDIAGFLQIRGGGINVPFASESLADGLRIDGIDLQLRDVHVVLPNQPDFAEVPSAQLSVKRGEDRVYEVRQLVTTGSEWAITPELVAFFGGSDASPDRSPAPASADAKPVSGGASDELQVRIVSAELSDAAVVVSGFDHLTEGRDFFVPNVSADVDLQLSDVFLSTGGAVPLRSTEPQELSLSNVRASLPQVPDLAVVCGVQISLIPDDLIKDGRLAACRIDSQDVSLTEPFWDLLEQMSDVEMKQGAGASEAQTAVAESDAQDGTPDKAPAWQQVRADQFELYDGGFEIVQTNPEIPNFEGRMEIHTRPAEEEGRREYVIDASSLKFFAPRDASKAFASARSLQVIADGASLWSEKRVTSATLSGAEFIAGKQFDQLLEDPAAPGDAVADVDVGVGVGVGVDAPQPSEAKPEAPPAMHPRDDWHVGTFQVKDSVVIVENLAALIPEIPLPVKATLDDFPLTKAGFYAHEEPLKVEVSQIRIPSPYGQSRTPVAEFDSVFVHFTLGGLMRHELSKVELLNPAIYIGENLFWYVEFFRKDRKAEETVSAASATTTLTEDAKIAAAESEEWSIAQIDAHYGKLIIALNGSINPDLPAFPFSCSTALKEGTLSAQLDIPAGEYRPLEGVELMVKVTGGIANFNLPLGQQSNNLVQVFKAEELRYKQFLTTEVFLSVTYDQYGIYSEFGGKTYDGYTKGAVNLYINDDFTWDAWVTGTDVSATDITRVLTPEYYLMSGAADFEVIGQGDLGELYQAHGSFSMKEPGIISIPALDDLKKEFPDDWTKLESSLATAGISALRDLPYETCTAEFKLFAREGTLNLKAGGPSGSRDFQVAVHDYRIPVPAKILELAHGKPDGDEVQKSEQ